MKKTKADEAVLEDLKYSLAAFFVEEAELKKKRAEGISPEAELRETEAELTKELWDKYIESAEVFPDDRITVKFKF